MQNIGFITRFFLTGLVISFFVVSPFILDISLLPRFIILATVTGVTFYFLSNNTAPVLKFDLITTSYILYGIFSCISIYWSVNKSAAIFESSKTMLMIFVFIASVEILSRDKDYFIERMCRISLLFAFVLFALGCFQIYNLSSYNKTDMYFITAINGHKNLFSSILYLNLFFVVLAVLRFKTVWKLLAIAALVASVLMIILLRTKAVWLAGIFSILAFMLYSNLISKWKIKFSVLARLIVLLMVSNLFFLLGLKPAINKSLELIKTEHNIPGLDEERLVLWKKTLELVPQNLMTGFGSGNWQVMYPDATLSGLWRAEDLNYTFQRPHNDFLWILSETGIIGLNLFLIFIFLLLLCLSDKLKTIPGNTYEKREVLLCIAFIIGYLVIAFFDFPKERIEHGILLHIILAIAYTHIRNDQNLFSWLKMKSGRPIALLIMCCCVFITYIGILRYKGEFYTRKIFDSRNDGQNALTIKAAGSAFSFAYTLDPLSMPLPWYTGNARTQLKNNPQVILQDFKKAYDLNPCNRNVLNDLASAYALNGEMNHAKKYFQEASRISPRFDEPKLNLVAIYINEKNYNAASTVLQTIFHNSERRTQYQKIVDVFNK